MNPVTKEDWMAAAEAAAAKAARLPEATFPSEEELEEERRKDRMNAWPQRIPARFRDAHVDQLEGPMLEVADGWDGTSNVLLLGGVGVGKTHAAVALARREFEDGRLYDVQFAPAVELMDDLRPGGDANAADRAMGSDLLILDDLGSERPTDWTAERLYLIVNRRWLECRPTIVTANLSAERLSEAVGPRMWSRLWHGSLAVEVAGEDRRVA